VRLATAVRASALVLGAAAVVVGVGWWSQQDARPPAPALTAPAVAVAAPQPAAPSAGAGASAVQPEAAGAPVSVRVGRTVAPVVPVAARAGVLEPPADPALMGWWRDGAGAGAPRGTVLLTGHATAAGSPAEQLVDVRAGQRIRVDTAAGVVRYAVVRREVYDAAGLAAVSARLFAPDGPPRLVVVTCSGWDGAEWTSSTVLVARPVPPPGP